MYNNSTCKKQSSPDEKIRGISVFWVVIWTEPNSDTPWTKWWSLMWWTHIVFYELKLICFYTWQNISCTKGKIRLIYLHIWCGEI